MFRSRPPRLKTFNYLGFYRYFLTICTACRRPHFASADVVESVLSQILRAASYEGLVALAYCFMPDHAHLLAEGTREDADLVRFLSRAKQLSGSTFARTFGSRLWQEGTYERVLRGDDSTVAVARYIFENPIRAGLALTVAEYPFSGSALYTMEHFAELLQSDGTTWRPDWRGCAPHLRLKTRLAGLKPRTYDALITGKIALAHLKELPDYYTRLSAMDKEADNYWANV